MKQAVVFVGLLVVLTTCAASFIHPFGGQLRPRPRPHVLHPPLHTNQTIWDLLEDNPNLQDMKKAIEDSGLESLLSGLEPDITLFAPNKHAFHCLSHDYKSFFKGGDHQELMAAVALYHMVQGTYSSSLLEDEMKLYSLSGIPMKLYVRQLLDHTFVESVNQATIISKDLYAANGVIHVIDSILLPNRFDVNISTDNTKNMSLAEVVWSNKHLSTFSKALNDSGLIEELNDTSKIFTLFAPIDQAWHGAYLQLLDSSNQDKLKQVLKYHLVHDRVHYSIDIQDDSQLKTSEGSALDTKRATFLKDDKDRLYVDNGEVEKSDIVAKNGVVHLINRVLLPRN